MKYLEKNLSQYRYEHTVRVTDFATRLNSGLDQHQLALAGLCHDISKEMRPAAHYEIFERNNAPRDYWFLPKPLLHSKSGYYLANELFNINDEQVHQAISYHTTGRAGMGPLARTVFAADYLGSLKKKKAEKQVKLSVHKLCLKKVKKTMKFLLKQRQRIHADTIGFYNSLVEETDV